ncbi:hypothetical protein DFQ28_006335 [Apophysomyces sp. BC1034]|nr:hypothetical protein DFQ30_009125 [Apophysomyces sp. BC1015]KAG0181257.1 hypothetical protein DFQ29_008866 [Apophysomyces sp. BC1021]KAG0193112.1 hypothetical protein DFQ28_006335 [Apophysomyces sp. BC1034]
MAAPVFLPRFSGSTLDPSSQPMLIQPLQDTFVLPRFSGSTLEPSSEPLMLYPSHMYEKKLDVKIIPTGRTKPLCRKDKPGPITIPTPIMDCFFSKGPDDDEFSAWSYEEPAKPDLLWDNGTQTIYSAATSSDSPSYSPNQFFIRG